MVNIRILTNLAILSLLALAVAGCGEQDNCQNDEPQSPECLLLPDGFFELFNLDIHYKEEGLCREFEGVLVETPLTGPSGYLVLRDKEEREFRFEDQGDVEDWEKMLDGIQIGKNYSFVISIISLGAPNNLHGMRICSGERLQFFAATYIEGDSYPFTGCFGDQSSRGVMTLDPLAGTDLEGFTYEQLFESLCRSREVEFVSGSVSLFRNIPMLFQYENQSVRLYQSQEATLGTSHGDFLLHVYYSVLDEELPFSGYSFYIKRLQE